MKDNNANTDNPALPTDPSVPTPLPDTQAPVELAGQQLSINKAEVTELSRTINDLYTRIFTLDYDYRTMRFKLEEANRALLGAFKAKLESLEARLTGVIPNPMPLPKLATSNPGERATYRVKTKVPVKEEEC